MPWLTILQFVSKYRKWFIYGAAILAILFALRLYGNSQWEKGVTYGDSRTQVKMEKAYADKWQQAQKQIDGQRRLLDEQAKANAANIKLLTAKADELRRLRSNIDAALERALEVAEAGRKTGYDAGASLTDATVDDAIRTISRRLESDRGAGPADPR